ncbi:serine/threonine-protein kinase Nek5-like [Narcine bancroftii]|uniref:serine/threonine-protein kinase Nek5-like n=1 Tax=Narcine bancroftii TaxID=1343680 RepID=UPI0038314F1F
MDKYDVTRQIGEGAFGKAFLVKTKGDSTQVVKEIKIAKMHQKEREDSFREVTLLEKMKHPNIVTFLDSFEERQNLYIVIDYCDGGDLMQRVNMQHGVCFEEEQILDWFVQICLGLKHIHDRKILHRDIKTQEIFLCNNGKIAKLGDFGIARMLNNNLFQFEGNNLHQLVMKICRGRYTPIHPRYTYDIQILLAQLFKVNPCDRPSINSILKKSFLEKCIRKYLTPELLKEEFSHTVIHRRKSSTPKPTKTTPRPASKIPKRKREAKNPVRQRVNKKQVPAHCGWKPLGVVNRPNIKKCNHPSSVKPQSPKFDGQYEHFHCYLDYLDTRQNESSPVPHFNGIIQDYRQKVNHDPSQRKLCVNFADDTVTSPKDPKTQQQYSPRQMVTDLEAEFENHDKGIKSGQLPEFLTKFLHKVLDKICCQHFLKSTDDTDLSSLNLLLVRSLDRSVYTGSRSKISF